MCLIRLRREREQLAAEQERLDSAIRVLYGFRRFKTEAEKKAAGEAARKYLDQVTRCKNFDTCAGRIDEPRSSIRLKLCPSCYQKYLRARAARKQKARRARRKAEKSK
jgi:hypothetical protein